MEPFVPKQAPVPESKKMQRAQARDKVWITEYWIELTLILLGLNVGPILYYYFAARASGNDLSFESGVPFIDSWLRHLTAPVRYAQFWTSQEQLPEAVPAFARAHAPLLALCASLLATVALLWSKNGLLQSLANMTKMQAAPMTHLAIAWSWMSAPFPPSSLFELVPWAFSWLPWVASPVTKFLGFLLLVVFSHTFAGAAQSALYLYLLFVFSGLGKRLETGSFGVHIPDPDALAAAAVSGGGAAAAPGFTVPSAPDDLDLAQLFAGPGAVAVGGGAATALGDAATRLSGMLGDAAAAPNGVDLAATAGTAATATTAATGLAGLAMSDDTAASVKQAVGYDVDAVPFPEYVAEPQMQNTFVANLDRGAYQASRVTNEVVLALFAAVKLYNANMHTTPGNVFAITANSLLILGSVGTALFRLRPTYDVSPRVPW